MSFSGDLEHLPIVDVIQLLHASRKSGILRVKSRKGESQLVFKDGYVVSANHLNNTVRIGKILVDLNVITPAELERGLQLQKEAGRERRPLIVTLIEQGLVKEQDAYKGLEQLIEMTVVEILTWRKGTFTLEVLPKPVADEYRYYPERINREINVDTQSVLMDALRIFDEKMRDGELAEEDFPEEEDPTISADDLGLADLDQLERKVPEAFSGLSEIDPAAVHRQKLEEIAPALPLQEREELASFLGGFSSSREATWESVSSVIFFSPDKLMSHAVAAVCTPAGIPVTTVSEEQELEPILVRALAGNCVPILVIDAPQQSDGRFSPAEISSLRQRKRAHYPEICTIQLAAPGDAAFALQSYMDGARAVLPRPSLEERRQTYIADSISFLAAIRVFLRATVFERESPAAVRLKSTIARLPGLRDATSVARVLLECVAGVCGRSLTLIVRDGELVADRGIGEGRGEGIEAALGLRIPLERPSLLCDAVVTGCVHYGPTADETVRERLFAMIGTPSRSTVLLLPMRRHGKTVALTYGDFGGGEPAPLDAVLLEILASQAELVMENALYRKKLAKTVRQGAAVS